jgi:hypothetical protein
MVWGVDFMLRSDERTGDTRKTIGTRRKEMNRFLRWFFPGRVRLTETAVAVIFASGAGMGTSLPTDSSRAGIPVVVEDFESYASDSALAKAWYRPPHGNQVLQSREENIKNSGRWCLKLEYQTEPGKGGDYVAVCRVHPWNLAGTDAVRFWVKPDGSGRHLDFEMNIADSSGRNIHDLWSVRLNFEKGDDGPRTETVRFCDLRHNTLYRDSPNVSPVFKPADVIEIAFYIGGPESRASEGIFYIDDIQAVRLEDDPPSRRVSGPGFEAAAGNALEAMARRAEALKIRGVAVVAFFEGDSLRSWTSKMAVVGAMKNAPSGDSKGDNLLAIAYSKASEMAETLKNSGNAGRPPMTGEFGWPGGLVLRGKAGTWVAAFSGGPSEDDVKVSRAGLETLAGR